MEVNATPDSTHSLSTFDYDTSKFKNQVLPYGFPDHHNPPFHLLVQIVNTIHSWLTANEKHIAVVHCKAGKGRTGTVICSYLLFEKICKTPDEALEYFKKMRSGEKQTSVDEPSQVRYIGYFHEFLNGKKIEPVKMHLQECVIHKIGESYAEAALSLEVYYFEGNEDNCHEKILILKKDKYKLYQDGTIVFDIDFDVEGDVVIDCNVQWTLSVETVFRYSFHTAFIHEPTIKCVKDDLDETYKKSDSIFSSVEFKFKL